MSKKFTEYKGLDLPKVAEENSEDETCREDQGAREVECDDRR